LKLSTCQGIVESPLETAKSEKKDNLCAEKSSVIQECFIKQNYFLLAYHSTATKCEICIFLVPQYRQLLFYL